MLTYETLKKQPRRFLALTGLTPREFKVLLPAFVSAYQERYPTEQTQAGKPRQRKPGGGRASPLASPEARLLFVLVYQKTYALQIVQGELFGLGQAQANSWIHRLLPILQATLDDLGFTPEREGSQFAKHERKNRDRRDVIIDGTDRRRPRPKNPEKQALHYSGRRKAHMDKNVLIATRSNKRIAFLSTTEAGTVSDKKLAEQAGIHYPRGTRLRQDLGFDGYKPRVTRIYQPKKSRRSAN